MASYTEISSSKIPGYQPVNSTTTTKSSSDTFDSEDFMELLLAQMRNQSPLDPMSDTEMMSQMAALNSLEELKKINTNLSSTTQSNQFLSATNLIGKEVTYTSGSGESAKQVTGKVTSVVLDSGKVLLTIGTEKVTLDSVVEVKESA